MRNLSLSLVTIAAFCILLLNCNDKKTTSIIDGGLVNHSECKSSKSALIMTDVADTLSCVNFVFDQSTQTLYLSHLNAGFNCCPESLFCSIKQISDTLVIEEFEKSNTCDCNCLFDLDYELTGIEKQVYFIKFIEPYATDLEPLYFEIDLTGSTEGSFCVSRKHYPWGMSE